MTRNSRLPLLATAAALLVLATSGCGTPEKATASPAGATDVAPVTSATTSPAGSAGAATDGHAGILTTPVSDGITLRVTGKAGVAAQISYAINRVETEDDAATLPWQRTADPAGTVSRISLIAMSRDTDDLSCEIFVDGVSVLTAQAGAQTGGVASCEWTNKDL
ncbi:MmpS family transport accessory protein [Catenuloplanes japonicus]|uniref:MmpS family transport accessory protein n=1 Tax=Catenuloplanes japonicus TaxID=33876 RepID=UPI000525C2B5|nr:MmpS family transport accessory protein [Catenuloplanes japonicus]